MFVSMSKRIKIVPVVPEYIEDKIKCSLDPDIIRKLIDIIETSKNNGYDYITANAAFAILIEYLKSTTDGAELITYQEDPGGNSYYDLLKVEIVNDDMKEFVSACIPIPLLNKIPNYKYTEERREHEREADESDVYLQESLIKDLNDMHKHIMRKGISIDFNVIDYGTEEVCLDYYLLKRYQDVVKEITE
jgi:hypothetical protein